VKIYRHHVIEALETESLGWQGWIKPADRHQDNYGSVSGRVACTVSAVGAVFRKWAGSNTIDQNIEQIMSNLDGNFASWTPTFEEFSLPKNWLTSLAFMWSHLHFYAGERGISVEEARAIIIDWVEANVPEDEVLWEISA